MDGTWDGKSIQNRACLVGQFLIDFGTNLDGFWKGVGCQVGTMLGPNATKTGPKKQSKKSSLFGRPPERILINSWWILGPTWGGQGGQTNQLFGDLLALGAKMRPRPLQEAPRAPKSLILVDFW